MSKVYKTAMGKKVDMDMLRLANENVIAIGNMSTNARGDELGKGGKVVKSRAKLMQEYHKLNTPTATEDAPKAAKKPQSITPVATDVETKIVRPSSKDSGIDEEDL
jgi:hypothetical protein